MRLVLECGTEAGSLDDAASAWHELEEAQWRDRRREWLGRRLGVALARSGGSDRSVSGISEALPRHARCLRFWTASTAEDHGTLVELAAVPVRDLYGVWAASGVGAGDAAGAEAAPAVGPAVPGEAVAWLLDHAGPGDASREWQRQLTLRRATPREAVGAARLAADCGQANTAIKTLLSVFPELATIRITEVPEDVVAGYLPLRWPGVIRAAAAETGLDPWLIAAVARQESTFVADARSPAGAIGVLQLLPTTARLHARRLGLGSRPDLGDPTVNIRVGAHELAWLMRRYGAVEPALAAYNAGDRRVRRWWSRWPNAQLFTESIPIPETYTYVRRVVFLADAYRQIHAAAWKETR